MVGAIGHVACEVIVDVDTEVVKIINTISEFNDPSVEIDNPRKEAAEILSAIEGTDKNLYDYE